MYGVVVVSAVGAVVTDPTGVPRLGRRSGERGRPLATTTVRAAPLHGRLGQRGPEPDLVRALLRADRVRTACAVLAVVAAVAHALRP